MVCLELAWLFTEERRAMSKKVLLDPSTGLEDRNARPEVVAAKLHEMAEHCGGNALVIGPTERGVLWNHLARVLIPAAERSEEHTSELQSQSNLVCRLLLEKKKT